MGYTAVRSHTRNGHQVRSHTRRTNGLHITDILQRELDRVFERIDQQGATEQISSANPDCPHPDWYPVRHVDGTRILAYACTGCAASRPADEARERALAEGEAVRNAGPHEVKSNGK